MEVWQTSTDECKLSSLKLMLRLTITIPQDLSFFFKETKGLRSTMVAGHTLWNGCGQYVALHPGCSH